MAASLNTVALVGRVLTEGDRWETESGVSVARFTLGLTNQAKVDGEWTEATQRVPVLVLGKRAEVEWAEGQTVSIDGCLEQHATGGELVVIGRNVSPVSEPVAEAVA